MKRGLRFEVLLWGLAVVVAVYLLVVPAIQNAWAARYWTRVPAYVTAERYHYKVGNAKYLSDRRSFWHVGYKTGKGIADNSFFEANGTCLVSPRDPEDAVRELQSLPTAQELTGRMAGVAVVTAVAGLLTWKLAADRRKARPASAPPPAA